MTSFLFLLLFDISNTIIDNIYLDIQNITLTFITFYNLVLKNAVTLDLKKNLKHEKIFSTIIFYFFYSLFVWTN